MRHVGAYGMAILVGIVVSIAGTAVWQALLWIARVRKDRSGTLAGLWYQVTYYADDSDMKRIPWSVEVIGVSHNAGVIRGKMWRAHSPHFERRWDFLGRTDGQQ